MMFHDTTRQLSSDDQKDIKTMSLFKTYHGSINAYRNVLKDLRSQKWCKESIKCNHQKEEYSNCNNLSKQYQESVKFVKQAFQCTNLKELLRLLQQFRKVMINSLYFHFQFTQFDNLDAQTLLVQYHKVSYHVENKGQVTIASTHLSRHQQYITEMYMPINKLGLSSNILGNYFLEA